MLRLQSYCILLLFFKEGDVLFSRYQHIFFFWTFYTISGRKAWTFCGDIQNREYSIISFVYIFMWTVTSVQVRLLARIIKDGPFYCRNPYLCLFIFSILFLLSKKLFFITIENILQSFTWAALIVLFIPLPGGTETKGIILRLFLLEHRHPYGYNVR